MRRHNIQIPWNSLKEDHRNLDVELNMSGLAQTLHSLLKPLYINAMSCHACHVISCHVTLCYAVIYYATLRYIKSCYVMLRIIKSCYVMLCHVKLSCVMLITQRQQTRWPKIRFKKKNNNKEFTSKDCKLSRVLEAFLLLVVELKTRTWFTSRFVAVLQQFTRASLISRHRILTQPTQKIQFVPMPPSKVDLSSWVYGGRGEWYF